MLDMPPQPYSNFSSGLADAVSMITFDDPAFSTDPNLHPDHRQYEFGIHPNGRPPPYEVLVSPKTPYGDQPTSVYNIDPVLGGFVSNTKVADATDMKRGGDVHGGAIASSSGSSTPSDHQGMRLTYSSDTDQEELLSYLREGDHDSEADNREDNTRNIPSSLLPGRGAGSVYPVAVPDSLDRDERTFPSIENLDRSLPLPAAQRSISAPPVSTGFTSTRPLLPGRSNTTNFRQKIKQSELDRVDELDETSPTGYHHRGPYEVTGNVDTPPSRMLPLLSDQVSQSSCLEQ